MPGRPEDDRLQGEGRESDEYSPPDPLAVMRDAFEHGPEPTRADDGRHPTRFGRRRRSASAPPPAVEPVVVPEEPPAPRPAAERPGWSYSGPPAPAIRSVDDSAAVAPAPTPVSPPAPVAAEPTPSPAPVPVPSAAPVTAKPPTIGAPVPETPAPKDWLSEDNNTPEVPAPATPETPPPATQPIPESPAPKDWLNQVTPEETPPAAETTPPQTEKIATPPPPIEDTLPKPTPAPVQPNPTSVPETTELDWLSGDLPGAAESIIPPVASAAQTTEPETDKPETTKKLDPVAAPTIEDKAAETPKPIVAAGPEVAGGKPAPADATQPLPKATSNPESATEDLQKDADPTAGEASVTKPKRGLFRRRNKPEPEVEVDAEVEATTEDSMRAWVEANTTPPAAPPVPPVATSAAPSEPKQPSPPEMGLPPVAKVAPPPQSSLSKEQKDDAFGLPSFGGRHSVQSPPEAPEAPPAKVSAPTPFTDLPSRVTAAPSHARVIPDPLETPAPVTEAPAVSPAEDRKTDDNQAGAAVSAAPKVQPIVSQDKKPADQTAAPSRTVRSEKAPGYVAYRQASTARSALVGGCVIASLGAAAGIAWQVLQPGQTPLLILMVACGLLLLCLTGLLIARPGILSVTDGLIEVTKGKRVSHLDLNSPDLKVDPLEPPESKDWAVQLSGNGKEMRVDRSQVDVEEFLEILNYFQGK